MTSRWNYTRKHFNPKHIHRPPASSPTRVDARQDPVYVYNDDIVLAVNVALATGRPLLVRGESGAGKSSLARSVADVLRWRYYEAVITSRTQARDLLWDVDLVRRLHDAREGGPTLTADYTPYVVPGVLWWAFNREDARWRGAAPKTPSIEPAIDPQTRKAKRAVVLLDEIDKADPDVPNNLLVPLGSLQFTVDETSHLVLADQANAPLVFMTTNEERELPAAFLRRSVEVRLELPGRRRMLEIARAHLPAISPEELSAIADAIIGPVTKRERDPVSPISPAEFIDTARAKMDLEVGLDDDAWKALTAVTAWKHGRAPSD